jgi:hypothetical protein
MLMSAPAATMPAKLMRIKNPSSNVFDEADIAQRDAAEGFTAALVEAHHSSSSATNSRKPRQWAVIEIRSLAKVTDLGAPALANVGRDKSRSGDLSARGFQ